ncbi:hypothetical protein PHJA_002094000 [Phtheirospermum japonicum]|uniref:Uncharacterized protein n=1 Tax=Phtheirospermum japonicum TaxID=374723 RepID=A0A830CKI8_9LAMI|nr:hypothetical protein PHJA_002094000 [Phtheirospermum japonicum]
MIAQKSAPENNFLIQSKVVSSDTTENEVPDMFTNYLEEVPRSPDFPPVEVNSNLWKPFLMVEPWSRNHRVAVFITCLMVVKKIANIGHRIRISGRNNSIL